MFDIMVVAVLLALTVVALTRFPKEGGSTSTRFLASRRPDSPTCPSCRAAVSEHEGRCVTCGQMFVLTDQPGAASR
jgi:hypothetical protein